jgi:predicted secreted hydrolase
MYYQLRKKNATVDPFSQGTIIEKDGTLKRLNLSDIDLTVLDYWQSPLGVTYPTKWSMKIPEEKMELEIEPLVKNQELNLFVRYWEGAVKVNGFFKDQPVTGKGYVELTGYATRSQEE